MALPKYRTSHARKGSRRAHDALTLRLRVVCPQCGAQMQPHRVCLACGYYKGRKIIDFEASET